MHLCASKKATKKPVVDLWPPPNLPKALYGDQAEAFNIANTIHNTHAHCSYLASYISRNIRLCIVDFRANFKPTYSPNSSIFWSGNSDLYTHLSSIFCRIFQIQWFLHTVAAISKSWHIWIAIFASNPKSAPPLIKVNITRMTLSKIA